MEKASINAKGILAIPYALREKYGFLDNGMMLLIEQPEGILMKKLDASFFDAFAGKWADDLPSRGEFQAWHAEEIGSEEARLKTLP